ncbi:putative tRNA-splicing endonuclease subunit tsp-1 [Fulvia fulva]|uniref:tRNA-splicing endonuclease subunit tsp-1 n=1 Tax=Passalora fulva TaxID=5499 RepID=A0A9Q8L8K0_PASFU|nr:putative tRNA-splicing endonuclease subunit tsp-1 [Fulvia fulva]KAK4634036.1 putative tRNA-splicing endonuclease subunit tsp-1 [Fulvia fulva]KAK4636524.1 putative tRNA-splicing endonuclease subunit tsp-1 [Fulvia fulva]UJO12847.1 putative tRNA-splicing endonuclease subunit tsp-1 [Fulvia fulva]WPV08972.1 putative tRNA-splicing endonuclease subunit tsp-1 [Fulvia fulva]WPV25363.1 putative tRNA-splicing endonuclease subunit tsp-1 [Fulvia fulva]
MTIQQAPQPPSELQKLLNSHPMSPSSTQDSDLHNLALQIAHNLRYQHLWTDVRLHTNKPETSQPLSRPILSGIPPRRLYVHPDEQIELLQQQKDQGKTGMPELEPQREWVLPSHLREKWTLRRFGATFDAMGTEQGEGEGKGELLFDAEERAVEDENKGSKWRSNLPKRLLLATLEDDSTVVYYIVHDGIVKPRQN